MATSGSYDFNRTRNEIITGAFRKIGVVAQGQDPTAEQLTEGAEALNVIVKDLQNEGVRLWTVEWTTKAFENAASEVDGTDSKIYTCIRSHKSAAANKPITGPNWSTYWVLRGSTGAAWAADTDYVSLGDFIPDADTIGLEDAFIRDKSGYDHPLEIILREEYFKIPNKAQASIRSSKICLDVQLTPLIYLWPQLNNIEYVVHYLKVRKLEDFVAAANNPDLMVRWIRALIYRLAEDLADEYGIPVSERNWLASKGGTLTGRARAGDREGVVGGFIEPAYLP